MSSLRVTIPWAFRELFEPYEHKAFFGGRGSAKSHSFAEALLIEGTQGFQRIAVGRQYHNSNDTSTHQLFADKIAANNMGGYWQVLNDEIRGPHGSTVRFFGIERNPNSIKSLEGVTRFWGEEAQSFNKRSLSIILPTVRKPGSQLWWSWNPDKPDDPIEKLFRGPNPPPNSLIREVSFLDNDYFPGTRLANDSEALRLRDPEEWKHVYGGGYRKLSDAAIFKRWKIGRIDTSGLRPLFGLDFGFSTDPAAFVKIYVDVEAKLIYIAAECYSAGVETDAYPAFLDRITEARQYPITADSARPDTISYCNRHGFPMMHGAVKGPKSVEEGIDWLKGFDFVIDPDCPHIKREFENYGYEVDKRTLSVLPTIAKGFDHAIDAIRYAVEELRRTGSKNNGVTVQRIRFG